MSTLTVTTIQPDLRWEDKQANLSALEAQIMSIPGRTELVVLPEMFSTGFSMRPEAFAEPMDGPTLTWMKRVAAARRVILTGSLIIAENGHYYNRLVWMLPTGQYGTYDKRHRFAYAGEDQHYMAGNRRLIASVKGWRVNLQVCYDLRFPVWARQTPPNYTAPASATPPPASGSRASGSPDPASPIASGNPAPGSNPAPHAPDIPEYDLLIYVANWPERRSHAWKTLLQARAIENQCYTVGVNRVGNDGNNIYHSGDSMIIDPLGTVLYQGGPKEEIFTCTLEKEKLEEIRTRFPFWKDGDHFSIQA